MSVFHLSRKQSLQGDNTGFNMIYRIGVKGDDVGLQSVDARLSVSSPPVDFRSGFCLQQAEVTGEKPASTAGRKKLLGTRARKGQTWPENRSNLVAGWEKESRCFDFLLASEHGAVCGCGWDGPPWFFLEIYFQLREG